MTTMLTDREVADDMHTAVHYREPVSDSENISAARAAITASQEAEKAVKRALRERNRAIERAASEDEMTAPEIARATGMSLSNVRYVLGRAGLLPSQLDEEE